MIFDKDYCDYETSCTLYELGFYLDMTEKVYERNLMTNRYEMIPKPLLYEAQKWLREVKFLLIVVDRLLNGEYVFSVVDILNYSEEKNGTANSYEEAFAEGIKEAIRFLKE